MPETLVINASPLIFLGNADRLELLRSSGASRFVAPPAVLDEVTVTHHMDAAARRIAEANWIERAPQVAVPADVIEWDLGPGSRPSLRRAFTSAPPQDLSSMTLRAEGAHALSASGLSEPSGS